MGLGSCIGCNEGDASARERLGQAAADEPGSSAAAPTAPVVRAWGRAATTVGEWDGEQQPRAADEVPDDFSADLVTGEQVVGAAPGDAEQQEQRQGRAGVGEHQPVDRGRDVVVPDPHPAGEQ